jgi:hypothetical protein
MKKLLLCDQAKGCKSEKCRFKWTTDPKHLGLRWEHVVEGKDNGVIFCEDMSKCGFPDAHEARRKVIVYEP